MTNTNAEVIDNLIKKIDLLQSNAISGEVNPRHRMNDDGVG
jgi:hypothetical protein